MVPKFKCSACGNCCSKIGGFVSDSEREFIEEYGYGKMPLVQVHPVAEMTFPLWDFEAKRFKEYASEKKIDAKIELSRGVLDLDSGKFIVFTYHMNSFRCPFLLVDGKCSIYDKERAFVCNLFPFNKSPFLETGSDEGMFGDCPQLAGIKEGLDYENKDKLVAQLSESFGTTFLAAVQHDIVIEWSNKLILELVKAKKIRPAMNYPYDKLLKRIANSGKIDLMDFLVESGYKTKEEIDELIVGFNDFKDAKERVNS
jgi:Fe-S-cluster containining protein